MSTATKKNWASHQKKWYGRWHVWLGVIAGFIITVISLTGTILVFRDEIDQALNPEIFELQEQQEKLSFQELHAILKKTHPEWKVAFLFEPESGAPNLPYRAVLSDYETEVHVNPYTGAVTGARLHDSYFIGLVLEIHSSLLIPGVGKYVVGASALILVILIISGLRLWIPRKWKYLKSRLTIKRKAGLARQNYDLHQVVGFYFSPVLLMIALTGVVITFITLVAPLMFLLSFEPPRSLEQILNNKSAYVANTQPISADSALSIARKVLPQQAHIVGIGFPTDSTLAYGVYATTPYITQTGNNDFLYVDQYSGKINFNSVTDLPNTGKMYLNWIEPMHYGTFGGNTTRVIAFIASFTPSILFISGIIIWWPRWKGKKKRAIYRDDEEDETLTRNVASRPVMQKTVVTKNTEVLE